jgi:Fe-S-cluster-containing hydrogenase component 2
MKRLATQNTEACMTCLTCENACAQAFYKTMHPSSENLTCIHVGAKDNKPKLNVCVQCGKCAKACPENAIKQNDKGVFMIDKKACKNCGVCVKECPFQVMVSASNAATVSKCIACGICVKACPQDVLYIKTDAA